MKKTSMSEQDIRSKFITPAILESGWDLHTQIREEVTFAPGRIIVKGKLGMRGKSKRADYILYYKPNIPIAVIEAKDNKHSIGDGMQQALNYAEILDIPFVYSSNGDGFLEHNRLAKKDNVETELSLKEFPSPESLWGRYCSYKGIKEKTKDIIEQEYYEDGSGKAPRYYQQIAINRTTEAIANGQDRILLVMATGTGKTYTAFQIIWRLWKSKRKKRILFLADRNALVDQTKINDFKPFGDKMTKITHRKIDKAYEIYLSLYQAVISPEEKKNVYKQFSPDFFDLIIIDECHRGSAKDDSAWRDILDYFSSATQIGLTATPKETKYISNIHYFGEPVFTYSLKQGISDGFLAPYKVIKIDLDRDLQGWRPEKGKTDKHGNLIPDRIYNQKDFDKALVLEERTKRVAEKIKEYLRGTDSYDKTIVFCEDIEHAERMRQALVNQNAEYINKDHRYVMRITGDSQEGKAELYNFTDPESRYPVIVTTSRLLSTGIDSQTAKLIVIDKNINSMTEFKQIIGRGTRIREEFGKTFFAIMDFKKATELFADPEFDGEPVIIYEPGPDDSPIPPDILPDDSTDEEPDINDPDEGPDDIPEPPPSEPTRKYYVADVEVKVTAERVQYLDSDGKLITESLKDYTRKNINKNYASLDQFLKKWNSSFKKEAIIIELNDQGVLLEALADEVGKDYDPFDLICHVAFDQPPLTRKERAENVKKRNYFAKYGEQARQVLITLLDKYADEGIQNIEKMEVLTLPPIRDLATPLEIIEWFGDKEKYVEAVRELEHELYKTAS